MYWYICSGIVQFIGQYPISNQSIISSIFHSPNVTETQRGREIAVGWFYFATQELGERVGVGELK